MAIKRLTIPHIFGGRSASQYFAEEGSFDASVAVDPDLPIISTDTRTSGFAVPVGYAVFSGANVTSHPVAIINNPKNTLTYVVLSNGRLISYSSALGSETLIGTVTGGAAISATYYNNYVYIFTPTNVSRYGPLNNSPSLVDSVWTGATLGSQTALTNTTYPTLRSVSIPNHVGTVHGDGTLYFTDFINGQGLIHKISTIKVTDEGDTNGTVVPSLYNALDLPFGFYPTDIESYGTSLLITGISTTDTTINQGRASFVLWDPTDTISFYLGPVPLPDPLCTAALNANGVMYLFSGNASNGVRVSKYLGGESVSDIAYLEEGMPPFAGAVDALGNRIVWGGFTAYPTTGSAVWAYGSKDNRLPPGIQHIAKGSGAGTTPIVTALKFVQQSSNVTPKVVLASRDGTGSQIDQYSATATLTSRLRWVFNIGGEFEIHKLKLRFAGAVATNTSITPTIYLDDYSSSVALTAVNTTNYTASERKIIYRGAEMKNCTGKNNFALELAWGSTNPLPVAFPIELEIDVKEDEKTK